ncbi:MAG: hypothetical protein HOV80_38600 [Polyangiaceae bacterium]|nr:hypothetical protein [Polyangiaceae bacterium]
MTSGRSGGASKIGGVFLRAASGPLQYAASCISGNKIVKGLEELAPSGLVDAYHRGIGEVARMVGVPKSEVERVLPTAEVAAVAERMNFSQPRALSAWQTHAGQFGFLDVVTALTVDGRPVEIAVCIERVAGKVRADPPLAQPLEALAIDIAAWNDLVQRTRHVLEDRGWLAAAYRRRIILRTVLFAIPMIALIGFTIAVVTFRLRRDAVDALLTGEDPCSVEAIPQEKLGWASTEQKGFIATKQAACDARRAEEKRLAEEEERRLAKERAVREAREARERECGALADEVEKGLLSEATRGVRDGHDALLDRIAKKTLEPSDLGPDDPVLPCGDTPAKKRLESAYGTALLGDVSIWTQRADPGKYARAALVAKKSEIPQNALLGLADNAERTAKGGLTGGDPNMIAKAKRLCALAKELGTPGRGGCNAVEGL